MNVTFGIESTISIPGFTAGNFWDAAYRAMGREQYAYKKLVDISFICVSKNPMIRFGTRSSTVYRGVAYCDGTARGKIYISNHPKALGWATNPATKQNVLMGLIYHELWHVLAYHRSDLRVYRREDAGYPLKQDLVNWLIRIYGKSKFKTMPEDLEEQHLLYTPSFMDKVNNWLPSKSMITPIDAPIEEIIL